jgi:hypothetical protein
MDARVRRWTRGGGKRASVELGKDAKEDFEGRLCRGEARVEEISKVRAVISLHVP